jgi:hypothetical protein
MSRLSANSVRMRDSKSTVGANGVRMRDIKSKKKTRVLVRNTEQMLNKKL